MKTKMLFEEHSTQLVLTPENDWEASILGRVHKALPEQTEITEFYKPQNSYFTYRKERHEDVYCGQNPDSFTKKDSLLIYLPTTE